MTKGEAENAILFLEMQFGRSYQNSPRSGLIKSLMSKSAEAGRQGIDYLLLNERMLPAPVVVTRAVNEKDIYLREQQAGRERRENQQHKSFFDSPKNFEESRLAGKLIRAILAGIGRDKTIEGMMHMQTKFPGHGWATCANQLQEYYNGRKQ